MRAFVAIDLPADIRAALAAVQADLRVGRLVPEENLHLTLAFLEDQPEAVLRALHGRLYTLQPDPVILRLQGLELFGGKAPRVLYLRADGGEALRALRRKVRQAAGEVGIDLPRERFRPHVTLARFRRDMRPEQIAQLGRFLERQGDAALPPFGIQSFSLFASRLLPEGAVHEALAAYPVPTA
ncbi:RNA 2',3'-cyclic phosphodiesterase [Shimia sp. SDUM112013]|uniref:RNA 2',3'-cyclic phosphodiesterase n=1 Tax=Shimia sp. SDUM112013 TaxID=3136160 RepID=UPI0032EC6114